MKVLDGLAVESVPKVICAMPPRSIARDAGCAAACITSQRITGCGRKIPTEIYESNVEGTRRLY